MTDQEKELCDHAQQVYGSCYNCGFRVHREFVDGLGSHAHSWCAAEFPFPWLREELPNGYALASVVRIAGTLRPAGEATSLRASERRFGVG